MSFETNCFINCPFDDAYRRILKPILFTVTMLGLTPRIALESLDSGRPRIDRIVALIEESRFAIHDLSRLKATSAGEIFRLNMPFELGLDVGCRQFRGGRWAEKRCLILESERYRYQAAISDLSNSDIAVHGDDPRTACREVRHWLVAQTGRRAAPGPTAVWTAFNDFMADNFDALMRLGHSPDEANDAPIAELIPSMSDWIARRTES
jgi:hypothetical protein